MYVFAEVKAAPPDDASPHGCFEVILSAPTLDRDGEVIDGKAFDPLPDHITFDVDHGMSTATTVASGRPYYDGDVLKVNGTFSSIPRAQEVRTLVQEGHIRTTSVAFMSAQRERKDGTDHITKAELLNGAFVPIPSNREARVLTAKSYAERVASREEIGGVALHDLALAYGVDCLDDWAT
jgi:HK97 family phage prohead protease